MRSASRKLNPPPIRELGNATGFSFRLQDRANLGHDALVAARNQLLGMATKNKVLSGVRPEGMEDAPQLQLDIDRDKASALGLAFADINSTLSTALGSSYINDFPNQSRQQRVIVQADAPDRTQPEHLLNLYARNAQGTMVPFSAFARSRWIVGPVQLTRYNGYPAMKIAGNAAEGRSTGEAMDEMEKLAAQLPPGFGFEWTGQSLEEKTSGSQALVLFILSLLVVFLCLAALYESASIVVVVVCRRQGISFFQPIHRMMFFQYIGEVILHGTGAGRVDAGAHVRCADWCGNYVGGWIPGSICRVFLDLARHTKKEESCAERRKQDRKIIA